MKIFALIFINFFVIVTIHLFLWKNPFIQQDRYHYLQDLFRQVQSKNEHEFLEIHGIFARFNKTLNHLARYVKEKYNKMEKEQLISLFNINKQKIQKLKESVLQDMIKILHNETISYFRYQWKNYIPIIEKKYITIVNQILMKNKKDLFQYMDNITNHQNKIRVEYNLNEKIKYIQEENKRFINGEIKKMYKEIKTLDSQILNTNIKIDDYQKKNNKITKKILLQLKSYGNIKNKKEEKKGIEIELVKTNVSDSKNITKNDDIYHNNQNEPKNQINLFFKILNKKNERIKNKTTVIFVTNRDNKINNITKTIIIKNK